MEKSNLNMLFIVRASALLSLFIYIYFHIYA